MNFKLNRTYSLFYFILVLLVSSCKKDQGNYKYEDINEVNINGFAEEYTAYTGELFEIKPELNFTKDNANEGKYTYEWISLAGATSQGVGSTLSKVVSTDRNLSGPMTLPPSIYTFYYRVKDENTGVKWEQQFRVNVISRLSEGWLVLNDVNGKARLDMFAWDIESSTYKPFYDVLKMAGSDLELNGKPKMVFSFNTRDPARAPIYGIYVGTDKFSTRIDANSMVWKPSYDLRYRKQTASQEDWNIDWMDGNGLAGLGYVYANGSILYYHATAQVDYSVPINRLETSPVFKVSPFVAIPISGSTASGMMIFDETNKRFARHVNYNSTYVAEMPVGPLFDANNMKMDLVYMGWTPAVGGQTYAILKEPTADVFKLARFNMTHLAVSQADFHTINIPNFSTARNFAIDPQQGYLFYTIGSKLYQYDVFEKVTREMLDLSGREISLIKYQRIYSKRFNTKYIDLSRELMICTYEKGNPASTGKMEFYTVPELHQPLKLSKSYAGLGKVVSVAFCEN